MAALRYPRAHVDDKPEGPFQLLANEEFARLSRDEKLAYLNRAVTAVTENTPIFAFTITAPKDEDAGKT